MKTESQLEVERQLKEEGVRHFSLRAEAQVDIALLLNALPKGSVTDFYILSSQWQIGTIINFTLKKVTMPKLLKVIQSIPDGHIMYRTLVDHYDTDGSVVRED